MNRILLICFWIASSPFAIAQEGRSHVGNFYPLLDAYAQQHNSSLSFLSKDWKDTEEWRTAARAKLIEVLAFNPDRVPLNAEYLDTIKRQGYTQYLVRYSINSHQKTEAFLLIPDQLRGKTPAVIALHDHGGFYFYGKEKHTLIEDSPQILKDYIQNGYEGRTYGGELAKRGFIVLCPDAMYFGSQKLDPSKIPADKTESYNAIRPQNRDEKIKAFNKLASEHEVPVNKTILASGTTWLGIIAQGDRVAVDFLTSLPQVDSEKIASMGHSLGGLRSTYLFGLDSRIKAAVVTCFSTTYQAMLKEHVRHTWMMYVPGQYQYLDLPDVASLNAPKPLYIQNGSQDHLFSMKGMKEAEQKLNAIYKKMNASDKLKTTFYEKPHSMGIQMQEDAFAWLEQWLF